MSPEFRPDNHNKLTFSFYYAFSENYVLPISHDEVVHGKCSMLEKMSGPRELRYDSLRTFLAYMMAHPGKKLMFMGQEIAQFKEWNYKTGLDWDILKFEEHKSFQEFVGNLNNFYKNNSELWENDSDWGGFKWISSDDNQNSVIAFRRINKKGEELVIICNFQPREHETYSFGVPYLADYKEVFSTCGKTVNEKIKAVKEPMHGEEFSITIKLPSMSAMFFRATNIKEPKSAAPKKAAKPVDKKSKKGKV